MEASNNGFMSEVDRFTNHASLVNINDADQLFKMLIGDPHFKDSILKNWGVHIICKIKISKIWG